jgi:hypothetical protein
MSKTGSFAAVAIALILAGIAGWAGSNTQARVAGPIKGLIDPLHMMTGTTPLPVQHFDDLSLVFN